MGFQSARDRGTVPLWAFHGAPFENVWSILNFGFINAAQVSPQLGRHGHGRGLFGQGMYFSLEPALAASYVRPSVCLPPQLGRWRCLFVCQIAPGPLVSIGGQACEAMYQMATLLWRTRSLSWCERLCSGMPNRLVALARGLCILSWSRSSVSQLHF